MYFGVYYIHCDNCIFIKFCRRRRRPRRLRYGFRHQQFLLFFYSNSEFFVRFFFFFYELFHRPRVLRVWLRCAKNQWTQSVRFSILLVSFHHTQMILNYTVPDIKHSIVCCRRRFCFFSLQLIFFLFVHVFLFRFSHFMMRTHHTQSVRICLE